MYWLFQAVEHKLANVLIEVDSDISAVRNAGSVVAEADLSKRDATRLATLVRHFPRYAGRPTAEVAATRMRRARH
jgi:hypothetical protein